MVAQVSAFNGLTYPSRTDKANFAPNGNKWIAAFKTYQDQVNVVTNEVNTNAQAADAARVAAQTARDAAQAAAQNAAATANAALFVANQNYLKGQNAVSALDFQTYRRKADGASAVDPKNDAPNWALAVQPKIARQTINANATLYSNDAGSLKELSGAITISLDAAATLGPGWFVTLRNAGTSDITVDPNLAETIDGVTSGVIKPGMALIVNCDGAAHTTQRIDQQIIVEYKTSGTSGAWPLGVRRVKMRMVGGGSAGVSGGGACGAGAGYLEKNLTVSPGASYTYTVGAGGVGVSDSVATTGQAGGSTTLTYNGVTYAANGGPATAQFSPTAGGTATNGDINIQGGPSVYTSGGYQYLHSGSTPLGFGGVYGAVASLGYGTGGISSASGVAAGSGKPGIIILEY